MFSQNITECLKIESLEIMPENIVQIWSKLLLKFYSKVQNLDLKITAQAMALKFGWDL